MQLNIRYLGNENKFFSRVIRYECTGKSSDVMSLAELVEGKPAAGVSGLSGTEFGIHTLHFCFGIFHLLWNCQYMHKKK